MNSQYQEDVQSWFEEAQNDGPMLAPQSLLAALGNTVPELLHLINAGVHDACNQLHREFPGIIKVRYNSLEPREKDKVVALLRWFKQPLSVVASEHGHKEIGVIHLLIGACFGDDALFWERVEISSGRNDKLASFAAKTLRRMVFSFSIPPDAPIYERELLDEWEKACDNLDFISIGRLMRSFDNVIHPSTVMEQAVLCLQSNAPQKLLRIINTYKNPMTAWISAELLNPLTRLQIAEKTRNTWFLFFSLLYGGVGIKRRRETTDAVQLQLVKCLLRASRDILFWKQFLLVVNEFDYRYPDMQRCLGATLAKSSKPALEAYIASLRIRTTPIDTQPSDDADGIESCFDSFVAYASREKQNFFMKMLYGQWVNFIESPKLLSDESHTSVIFRTNIDCVASYFLKIFSTKKKIRLLLKESINRLNSFGNIWHGGSIEAGKFFSVELCKINVYYTALIDDSCFFSRPFPFRTPASLLESKYMQLLFTYQIESIKKMAGSEASIGRI